MGILDEAIREHLDLKRRRGADPTEIERDEREALGPVRRNRDPGTPADADEIVQDRRDAPVGSAYDEPDGAVAADLVDEYDEYDDPLTDEHESLAPVDDAPETRVMRATDVPTPGESTAEYDVEAMLDDEANGEDEDVLEETPEFLQDTPDHDRLWFEQRPPRDFDFDG
jgi:hypothetical protein